MSQYDWHAQKAALMKDIQGVEDVVDGQAYFVGYDGPFVEAEQRRNEIWIPVKRSANDDLENRDFEDIEKLMLAMANQ